MVRRIRAAVTAGVRPCAMVFRVQPERNWEDLDFKLMEAYQILTDETCPKCGQPVWLCRNTSDDFVWSVANTICYATRALEEKQENKKSSKDKKASKDEKQAWGRIEYAFPRAREGKSIPSREDYFKSLAE